MKMFKVVLYNIFSKIGYDSRYGFKFYSSRPADIGLVEHTRTHTGMALSFIVDIKNDINFFLPAP